MSASLWLTIDTGRGMKRLAGTEVEVTYNLSPMLQEAGWPVWREIVGRDAVEVGELADRVRSRLESDPERFGALAPANGYGTYDQAIQAMRTIAQAGEDHPLAVWDGSL